MSSINLTLERMTHQRALGSVAVAYAYAALLVAGPWIFTVVGIVGLSSGRCTGDCGELAAFRSIVIYNSLFALVATSPLAFLSGRYVADQVHVGRTQCVLFALVATLCAFGLLTLVVAAPFYLLGTTLADPAKFAAVQNAFLIGVSWLLIPFLGVIRAHNTVVAAFAADALAMILFGYLAPNTSVVTLLAAFNAGFALADAILIATLVRHFGNRIERDPALLTFAPWKCELPAAGFAYALGIWADKIVMWYGAPSGGLTVAGALQTMPSYDTAMFWAQLASIPVIAVAFVHVETRFSGLLRHFYGRLDGHASLRELTVAMEKLRTFVLSKIVSLFVALAIVGTMTVLLSFVFMNGLGLKPAYMGILRVSLCAMVFHTSAMFCVMFFLYFDLRRHAVIIVVTYLVLNTVLTLAFLSFGQRYYGYGTMIAAATTFLMAFSMLWRELSWLHYHAFITNNASL